MDIQLSSTTTILTIGQGSKARRARVWEGRTASGIPIKAVIMELAVPTAERQTEFERELTAADHHPEQMAKAWDIRHFID